MLGKGVVISGLLLATGIAGAQVLQKNLVATLQQSSTPQSGALGVGSIPASQQGVPGGDCQVFFTKSSFDAFNISDGKTLKGIEDFEESDIQDGQKLAIPAPLQGNVPSPGFPTGLTEENLVIQDNITPGPSPLLLNPSGDPEALFVVGANFKGSNSKKVGEDLEALFGQEASLDLIFSGDNKSGVGFDLSHFDGFGGGSWIVAVYDINNNLIGKFDVADAIEPAKSFFGVWCDTPIGRINIWDQGIAPDTIDNIQMWTDQVPTCQWDCEPVPDKNVGVNDFLALLAGWGLPGPCDFDGGNVGVTDFLKLLANWGPCPAPINDECTGKIFIDRFDSGGTHTEHFDMYGATPSPDPSQCLPAGDQAKDIWYCLTNSTMDKKIVTLTSNVDLLAEVTAGCDCANPGPLVACGRLLAAAPTIFTMQAGEQVCIRLHNDLDLPNDIIKGDLIITNEPAPPSSDKCYDQQPDQVNAFFSDLDCDTCVAQGLPPQQVLAEQLILVAPEMIDTLRFWGGYFPGDAGGGIPLPDNFTVKFRLNDDSTGVDLPGSVVRKLQIGPATTRTATGMIIFGVREFEYTIDLVPNQDLQPGFYWVEIYNDTTNDPTNDDWIWETGALDAVNGLPDFAFSSDPPNVMPKGWATSPGDLSLNITCKPDDGDGVRFHEDPAGFFANLPPDKVAKFHWGFKPDNLQQGITVPISDPLDIFTHPVNAPGVWDNADGTTLWPPEVDNVQFASNINPQGPYAPGAGLIYHKGPTPQFLLDNNGLVAEEIVGGQTSFHIFSGPPAGDNHTAFELEIVSATPGAVAVMHISVYDKNDIEIGKYVITMLPTEKRYLGIVSDVTIGRIDIWDTNGGEEGISSITAWQVDSGNPFGCPGQGDCCDPAGNGTPGCNNTECCRRVCAIDPLCCDQLWDAQCAQTALQFPQCQCQPPIPVFNIEPCVPPDCPQGGEPVWCVYDIINVLGDPVACKQRKIFIGGLLCVTPCPFPGDLVDCDPNGTGTIRFGTVENGCVFDAVSLGGCSPCPPGSTQWTRLP